MRPAHAPTVAVSKRTIFVLKTLRGKTVKAVGTLRPPDRRFKQSRASAVVHGAVIVRGGASRIRVLTCQRLSSPIAVSSGVR